MAHPDGASGPVARVGRRDDRNAQEVSASDRLSDPGEHVTTPDLEIGNVVVAPGLRQVGDDGHRGHQVSPSGGHLT